MKKVKKKSEYIFIPQDNRLSFVCDGCCFYQGGVCKIPLEKEFDCYGGIYKLKDEPTAK